MLSGTVLSRVRAVILAAAAATAVAVAAAGAPSRASESDAAAFIGAIFKHTGVTAEPCPAVALKGEAPKITACGRAPSDFESFRKVWDDAVLDETVVPTRARRVAPWEKVADSQIRFDYIEQTALVTVFDLATHAVTVCYPRDAKGALVITPFDSVKPPILADWKEPEILLGRRRSKSKDAPKGTVVVLNLVVLADGSVRDVSVLGCLPRGSGLEEPAIAAAKKWKYKPPILYDQPTDVSFVFWNRAD